MSNKLLILGAGQYGHLVREIAKDIGCFEKIAFLDDFSQQAIGKLNDYSNFKGEFTHAIVAMGNSSLRLEFIEKLATYFEIATLVHPRAYVSPSAVLGVGTVIEPLAVVSTGAELGKGCLVSAGAVINHNAKIEDGVHIDCNAVIGSRAVVEYGIRVPYSTVIFAD